MSLFIRQCLEFMCAEKSPWNLDSTLRETQPIFGCKLAAEWLSNNAKQNEA